MLTGDFTVLTARHVPANFSVSLTIADGVTCKVFARLNRVLREGLFSPRSSCPMYVRW